MGSSLVHSRLLKDCSSTSPVWRDAPDSRWGRGGTAYHSLAFRKDRNMWHQQQWSDSAEKLGIFFSFFGFLCCVCVQMCCLSVLSVVLLCVLQHMWVCLLIWLCVHLVERFIGLCNVRPCAQLAVAGTLHYQLTQWGVCCPCGNWSGDSHFQTDGLLCGPKRQKRVY